MLDALLGKIWRRRLGKMATLGDGARIVGRIWVRGEGRIHIGARVVLDASVAPIELHPTYAHSEIVLGDDVVVGSGTSIEAVQSIRIGERTRIGRYCRLMDSHFHPTIGERDVHPQAVPLVVENDVDMGGRCILVAGAYVEHHVTICPSSVVTRRVRAGSTVRGVPAHVIDAGSGGPK
jgi:acetyltransferase-like isoleucine patch superfamily enzyme